MKFLTKFYRRKIKRLVPFYYLGSDPDPVKSTPDLYSPTHKNDRTNFATSNLRILV